MRDRCSRPFRRLVIMGESTVAGGGWIPSSSDRFADVLASLIRSVQREPLEYVNVGIGANAISPKSPGYADSAKPSALERVRTDVIEHEPDLFIFCSGLNDMRAAMDVDVFIDDCRTILRDVQRECNPLTVLTTVYHMTGWRSFQPYDKGSPELTETYNQAIRELATEVDALVADVWRAQGSADWQVHPDGVHANRVGNLVIAHEIFATLCRNCSGLSLETRSADADTEWTESTTSVREDVGDPYRQTW